MTASVRNIAIWCDQTRERRAAVDAYLSTLVLLTGETRAMLFAQAQAHVYATHHGTEKPLPIAPAGPHRFIAIRSEKELRLVARAEITLGDITLAHCMAKSIFDARRQLPGQKHIIAEWKALLIIADLEELGQIIPDPLAAPRAEA